MSSFVCITCGFEVRSKEIVPGPMSYRVSPMFSPSSFIVSVLIFRCLTKVEFCTVECRDFCFKSLHVEIPFIEWTVLSLGNVSIPWWKKVCYKSVVSFLGLYPVLLFYVSICRLVLCCFGDNSPGLCLQIWYGDACGFVFTIQDLFDYSGSFEIPYDSYYITTISLRHVVVNGSSIEANLIHPLL